MERKNKFRKSNRMLLDELPLVLLPSLAKAVGVNEAVVIQQLHFHLSNPDNGWEHDSEKWIYKTYEDWQSTDFWFWSTRTIRRLFRSLKKSSSNHASRKAATVGGNTIGSTTNVWKIFHAHAHIEAAKSGASS